MAAEQLLGRAGFSGTPEEIQKLADMTPEQAVRSMVDYDSISNDHLQPFVHSGFWDETLMHFPPSRPAATDLALEHGESMGVRVNFTPAPPSRLPFRAGDAFKIAPPGARRRVAGAPARKAIY